MNTVASNETILHKSMGIENIPVEFGFGIYQAEIPLDRKHGIYHTFEGSTVNLPNQTYTLLKNI